MISLILRTTARYLLPLLVMFSFFLLLRGHNEPGGGFVAGLIAAASFALYALAYSPAEARRILRFEPRLLIALGLLAALVSGIPGLWAGSRFSAADGCTSRLPAWKISRPARPCSSM